MNSVIKPSEVTQFNIYGLKVTVKIKRHEEEKERELKGWISFFSRSNCRNCKDISEREKELIERTKSSLALRIFFNDKLFGDLVALKSLRNSGTFDQRINEMLGKKFSSDAPAPPLYGFDDHEEETMDNMLSTIKLLKQRLPIQDRLIKLKVVKNFFSGSQVATYAAIG